MLNEAFIAISLRWAIVANGPLFVFVYDLFKNISLWKWNSSKLKRHEKNLMKIYLCKIYLCKILYYQISEFLP